MNDLHNWTEITKGLYRYVLGANVAYEIHILCWYHSTDILTAMASLYLVGDWRDTFGNSYLQRELICGEQSVQVCLEAAMKDNSVNNA